MLIKAWILLLVPQMNILSRVPRVFPSRLNTFDAIVSNHNIEHCLSPERTLRAVVKSLKKGGKLYLAFSLPTKSIFPMNRSCETAYARASGSPKCGVQNGN